jgi:Protein of unknown function (DUF3467)
MTLPESVVPGVYADFVSVWHTGGAFTLDFAAMVNPGQPGTDDDTGETVTVVPAQVVARVRIPPNQVFEIMKALEQQLTLWESENGRAAGDEPAS